MDYFPEWRVTDDVQSATSALSDAAGRVQSSHRKSPFIPMCARSLPGTSDISGNNRPRLPVSTSAVSGNQTWRRRQPGKRRKQLCRWGLWVWGGGELSGMAQGRGEGRAMKVMATPHGPISDPSWKVMKLIRHSWCAIKVIGVGKVKNRWSGSFSFFFVFGISFFFNADPCTEWFSQSLQSAERVERIMAGRGGSRGHRDHSSPWETHQTS